MKSEIKTAFVKYWPTVYQGSWFPVAASIIIHAGMFSLLLMNWSQSPIKQVPPLHIKASLIETRKAKPIDELARKQSEKIQQAKKNEDRRKKEQAIAREKEQKQLALKKKEAAAKQKEANRKKIQQEQERAKAAQQKKERDALAEKLAKEQALREQEQQASEQEEKDAAEVAYYSNYLINAMSVHWNRPASARNDMEAVIEVRLSPFGELQGFKVINGSGNDAFDRSVLQAIKAGTPVAELKQLDRRIFEKYFRRFTFKFSPGDLVR